MEVDFAFLAEGAEASGGKFHVIGGGFDTIWTKQLPVVYPKMSLVLRLVFDAAEVARKHKLEIQIMDEDGGILATVGGDLDIGNKSSNLPKGWKQGFLSVLHFNGLNFTKFGDYTFHIVVNNSTLKSVLFRVAQQVQLPVA